MRFKLIFWQRFQNFKSHINSKLRSISIAYLEKIEQMINEIDSLISYFKNFNVITQSLLISKVVKNEQDVNAHAKSIAIIANNFSNNCQTND